MIQIEVKEMIQLLLFSIIIAVPYFLLLELWDKVKPAKD